MDDYTWTDISSTRFSINDWNRSKIFGTDKPKKPPEPEALIEKKNPTLDDILKFNLEK